MFRLIILKCDYCCTNKTKINKGPGRVLMSVPMIPWVIETCFDTFQLKKYIKLLNASVSNKKLCLYNIMSKVKFPGLKKEIFDQRIPSICYKPLIIRQFLIRCISDSTQNVSRFNTQPIKDSFYLE